MFYILLAASAAEPAELPDYDAAVLNAIDVCAQSIEKGTVEMNYPGEIFTDFPADMAARGKMRTNEEVPALIHRFAQTSPSGRLGRAIFLSTSSTSGPVWISNSLAMPFCDIAVTGQESVEQLSGDLTAALTQMGWQMLASNGGSSGAPVATYVLRKSVEGGEVLQMRITQLLVGADPEGIQLDIQLVRGTAK